MVQKNMNAIFQAAVFLGFLVILNQLIEMLQTKIFVEIHNQSLYSIFHQTFQKLIHLKRSYFDDKNTTEILNFLQMDVLQVASITDRYVVLKIYELLNISQIGTEECRSCWAFSLCGICAKWIDDGEGMSIENRKNACQNAKTSAYGKILRRILVYENSIHQKLMREIISKGENV